jgi:hypothetical protein
MCQAFRLNYAPTFGESASAICIVAVTSECTFQSKSLLLTRNWGALYGSVCLSLSEARMYGGRQWLNQIWETCLIPLGANHLRWHTFPLAKRVEPLCALPPASYATRITSSKTPFHRHQDNRNFAGAGFREHFTFWREFRFFGAEVHLNGFSLNLGTTYVFQRLFQIGCFTWE